MDAAPPIGARPIEIWMPPVCIGDEQGAIVVKDAEDAQAVLALIGSQVWDVVTATNLEPNQGAAAVELVNPVHT